MKLFNTIALEIASRCNRTCQWCPVAYNTRPDEQMDDALLVKAFGELAALGYNGRIEFYIYNEPAKDIGVLESVLLGARRNVPRATLMIATNGDYLKGPDNIMRLYKAGLNQLLINCYSKGLYEKRLKWWDKLPQDIERGGNVYGQTGPRKRIIDMLDKHNPAKFGSGIFRLVNRAGNVPQFLPAAQQPIERMCVKPFRLLNINWQGNALVCCQDYHGSLAFANLHTSTLEEIWNHPVMNTYRSHLLRKDRSLPLCRSCDCHAGAYPHNVPAPDKNFATIQSIEKLWRKNNANRGLVQMDKGTP